MQRLCAYVPRTYKSADQQFTRSFSHFVLAATSMNAKSRKMRRRLLMWLQLQVLVATVTDASRHNDNYTAPSVINVGLLQPLEGPLGFERTGSAATMAVRDAQRRGYLNQTEIKYSSIHCFISWSYFLTRDLAYYV